MKIERKDMFGHPFRKGDRVVYPTRRGSWMDMKQGVVVEIKEKVRWWLTDTDVVPLVKADNNSKVCEPKASRMINLTYYAEKCSDTVLYNKKYCQLVEKLNEMVKLVNKQ